MMRQMIGEIEHQIQKISQIQNAKGKIISDLVSIIMQMYVKQLLALHVGFKANKWPFLGSSYRSCINFQSYVSYKRNSVRKYYTFAIKELLPRLSINLSKFINKIIDNTGNMQQFHRNGQQTMAIIKVKKIKKVRAKKGLKKVVCRHFGENDSVSEMGDGDIDKYIQSMLECQNSSQKEKKEGCKEKRTTLTQNSRFDKDYPLAIIGQMIKAIGLLQGQKYRRIQNTLSLKCMLSKTKFVFLCIILARYRCFSSLSSILRDKLQKKEARMLKKYKDNDQRLQQGKQGMNKFQDFMVKISQLLQPNPNQLMVQDFIYLIFNFKQSRPGYEYTHNGLRSIYNLRLKQNLCLRRQLNIFDRKMRQQMEKSITSDQFIRPNICGVPIEQAHYDSFEDFSRPYFMQAQTDSF